MARKKTTLRTLLRMRQLCGLRGRGQRYLSNRQSPRTAARGLSGYSGQRGRALSPFAEPVAEELVEVGDFVNLVARLLPLVLDAAELDGVVLEHHVARPPVAVARLADRADVT